MMIRRLQDSEAELLRDFLYEAIFIPEGIAPPPREIIEQPELKLYYDGFGKGKADNAIVAEEDGKVVGAVWTRIMNDYGHVDEDTPSFAISLYKEYRGRGIGTKLMQEMLALLRSQGYKQASLAVQKANYAVKMYEKVGFEIVDENEEEFIMVCKLTDPKERGARNEYMKSVQHGFIDYLIHFSESRRVHIWLGGSFLKGTSTPFSDVDINVRADADTIKELIYGYGEPIFISSTTNPEGVLIVIYKNGVAVDMGIIASEIEDTDSFFHRESIKKYGFLMDTKICKEVSLRDDLPYQVSRLFHRSLIKYLAGKRDLGVSVAMEIVSFLRSDISIDEQTYKTGIKKTLHLFDERYSIEKEYRDLLESLIGILGS